MATEIVTSFQQICDANGVPISGAKIYVYDVGTTTLRTLYSDPDLDPAHETDNPIICNSSGRHEDGMVYTATGSYKIVVKTAADVSIYTLDNIDGRIPVGSGVLDIENGGTGADNAPGALAALGGFTAAEGADLATDVAALSGALASTEKTHIATGTTAQRTSSPVAGDIRHNTTTSKFEGYIAAWWDFFTTADNATQTDQEAGTSVATVVTPGRQHYHDSASKAWASVTLSGGTPSLGDSYNVTSVTDNGQGDFTLNFTNAFSSANYAAVVTPVNTAGANTARIATVKAKNTTSCQVQIGDGSFTLQDNSFSFIAFGDL